VNWNGWSDTAECLESVLRSDYPRYRVIVCDNGSRDGSLAFLRAWAEGRLDVLVPRGSPLRDLSFPPIPKPVPVLVLDRRTAEAGGPIETGASRLVLVGIGKNLGYAGGNNVGLRFAQARSGFDYVWLLNPDTVVAPDALRQMVAEMRRRPDAGLCGSTVRLYDDPERLHALGGGTFYRWIAATRLIGKRGRSALPEDAERVRRRLSLILGASMLVSRAFLDSVGLLNEDYFLFLEEIDWAVRGRDRFALTYAPRSVVYHKKGRATGLGVSVRERSTLAEYHLARSRLRFTRTHYPRARGSVFVALLLQAAIRLLGGRADLARAVLRAIRDR
jgi:GT2 family glycosyltransferase